MAGKFPRWTIGFIAGVLVSAIPFGLYLLTQGHHYSEYGTFFKGSLGSQQVAGVAFVEYDGLSFMELTQWKVELVNRSGQRVILYRKSAVFQEKIPHQPKIEIIGQQIQIDDGENKIAVTVQEAGK